MLTRSFDLSYTVMWIPPLHQRILSELRRSLRYERHWGKLQCPPEELTALHIATLHLLRMSDYRGELLRLSVRRCAIELRHCLACPAGPALTGYLLYHLHYDETGRAAPPWWGGRPDIERFLESLFVKAPELKPLYEQASELLHPHYRSLPT